MVAEKLITADSMAVRERDGLRRPSNAVDSVTADPPRPEHTQSDDDTPERRRERRGLWTVIGAFAICPCHLPITMALLGVALGGSAAGAFLRDNAVLAGALITTVWAAITWRGIWLLRHARSCPLPESIRPSSPTWVARLRLYRRQ